MRAHATPSPGNLPVETAEAAPLFEPGRKLLFLVTEDWYFWSHRLPVARAARDAGLQIVVACRVREHGARILAEGFALRPLAWRRRHDGVVGGLRALLDIIRLYRQERPDLLHHVALKPVLFGAVAARLAFPYRQRPARIDAVMGLGSGFTRPGLAASMRRVLLRLLLRCALRRSGRLIVQNPDDRAVLLGLGVAAGRIALIRGSGVDMQHFRPLPEPAGPEHRVGLVSRMLRDKGVPIAVEAVRRLRAQGRDLSLVLAGAPDADNPGSLGVEMLRDWAAEPGIEWLGQIDDVRAVWSRAVLALLPSTYGEGVPKALLEAAACGRACIATDLPGCREAVLHGETGLLVPPGDAAALSEAIASLLDDLARRAAMGEAGRRRAEAIFAETVIAAETIALYRELLEKEGGAPMMGTS